MSMGYVIPEVSREAVLDTLEIDDDIIVTDDGEEYKIQMPIDKRYSLTKRIQLAQATNLAPDQVQQGSNIASIWLVKAADEINSWFWATAISINHPELILNRIVELLKSTGKEAHWSSENDQEYWNISGHQQDDS